ncbi:MAG TPA: hypothetical protein PLY25_10150 [Bacteroidia bacterium]|nr:hypothetical protein [Bacteroidia bacterium]
MQQFVKGNRFILGGRTFLILSGMDYDPELPTWTPPNQVGNCVSFIEIDPNRTFTDDFGRVRPVEFAPKIIAEPKNKEEKRYNQHARISGTNVRDKTLLYYLIDQNKLQII